MKAPVFRPATDADLPRLSEIYIDAVTNIGPVAYTPGQIKAWASWPSVHPDEFHSRVSAGSCWVADCDGEIGAFAVFVPPDHLDFLYTRGKYARQGLATQLHQHLEGIATDTGAPQLRTEASYLSRPAFTKFGYHVESIERVERYDQTFTRFNMRKRLTVGPPATQPAVPLVRGYATELIASPSVAAEETVQFLDHDINHPGWFRGIDPRNVEGYFPLAWFILDTTSNLAIAQRDYDATELEVSSGETIYPITTLGPWIQACRPDLTTGWFPAACLAR